MNLDFDLPNYDFSTKNRTTSMRLPSIIIINPHANVRPENATGTTMPQQQIDPLVEIGKVARPLMLDSTASSNITFSGVPTPPSKEDIKNSPKLYAQKPYNKTIGMLIYSI